MILSLRSRHLEVFAATQDRDYDIVTDSFRDVRRGFRVALHIRVWGKLRTWVWARWSVRALDYQRELAG